MTDELSPEEVVELFDLAIEEVYEKAHRSNLVRWLKDAEEENKRLRGEHLSRIRDFQPVLTVLQHGLISTGKARECLKRWLRGEDFRDPANREWERVDLGPSTWDRIERLEEQRARDLQVLDLIDRDSDDQGKCLYCKQARPGCEARGCGLKLALSQGKPKEEK